MKLSFVDKSTNVHKGKYDYSNTNYIDSKTKVCIICPTHGEFWQLPTNHLKGCGCSKCKFDELKKKFSSNSSIFIEKAKEVHGDNYDYSKVAYVNAKTKVCIICPTHGEFWQVPDKHLQGQGCSKCNGGIKSDNYEFVEKSKQIHKEKYDYSKVEYVKSNKKVCIICPTHGEFWQTPHNHLKGKGCPLCANNVKCNTEEFIEKAKKIHGDKYDYSKIEYINAKTKVCIICPIHGEFWQTPNKHLYGNGCPICKESRLECDLRLFFSGKIIFEQQKRFKWLGKQSLDFFIPSKNIAIECQGRQHFVPFDFSSKHLELREKNLKNEIRKDERKRKLCEEHGIKILYFSNLGIDYPYAVFEDKQQLLEAILK